MNKKKSMRMIITELFSEFEKHTVHVYTGTGIA